MGTKEIRDSGHHLAIAAAFRVLAAEVARLADPVQPGQWFTELGQTAFQYVDASKNPSYDPKALRAVKEAAYDTLRMMFDPRGFED
jgi:hypothetical protein